MSATVSLILGFVLGIAAVVAAYIFVIPEKRVRGMNKFLYALHNIFTFKQLLIEKINRFMYVFLTILFVCIGFFMLFTVVEGTSMFLAGLLMIIILPLVLRVIFEASMLKILMTNNLIEINKKMAPKPAPRAQRPAPRPAPAPRYESQDSYNPYGE